MRILIATPLYPPDGGGPATYTALLERELPARRFEVDVVKYGDVLRLPYFARHIVYFFKVLRRGIHADVIFAQDPLGVGFPSLCAARILGKKFVVKIVGDRAWEEYMNQKSGLSADEAGIKNQEYDLIEEFQKKRYKFGIEIRRWTQKFVARRADKIIVPSKYLKKILVDGWKIDGEKIEIIYNSFEVPKIEITQNEAREKLGISPDEIVIVSIGRLVTWKGFGTLIEIMSNILKRFSDAKLYIIGDGPEKKNLELSLSADKAGIKPASSADRPASSADRPACRVDRNYELDDSVFLKGNVSHNDTLLYLTAADVMALNTGYEGLSHVILEAMALGAPVITTRVGGNPELIEDSVSGRLVSYNDKTAFTEAIFEILNNEDVSRRYSFTAQKKAQEFSKEKMLEQFVSFLKNV